MSPKRDLRLTTAYTLQALQDLDEVAAWNIEKYGLDHAAR